MIYQRVTYLSFEGIFWDRGVRSTNLWGNANILKELRKCMQETIEGDGYLLLL